MNVTFFRQKNLQNKKKYKQKIPKLETLQLRFYNNIYIDNFTITRYITLQ